MLTTTPGGQICNLRMNGYSTTLVLVSTQQHQGYGVCIIGMFIVCPVLSHIPQLIYKKLTDPPEILEYRQCQEFRIIIDKYLMMF
jgi:hypothetical protein